MHSAHHRGAPVLKASSAVSPRGNTISQASRAPPARSRRILRPCPGRPADDNAPRLRQRARSGRAGLRWGERPISIDRLYRRRRQSARRAARLLPCRDVASQRFTGDALWLHPRLYVVRRGRRHGARSGLDQRTLSQLSLAGIPSTDSWQRTNVRFAGRGLRARAVLEKLLPQSSVVLAASRMAAPAAGVEAPTGMATLSGAPTRMDAAAPRTQTTAASTARCPTAAERYCERDALKGAPSSRSPGTIAAGGPRPAISDRAEAGARWPAGTRAVSPQGPGTFLPRRHAGW